MNFYMSLLSAIRFVFWAYGILIFIRVISSWFPQVYRYSAMRFVFKLVDPYLAIFRRFIPLIGGTLDISPIVAFFALQLFEKIVLWLLF